MIGRLAIVGVALLLTGCKPTAEQHQHVLQALPPGCSIFSLGPYGSFDDLVVITCDGRVTTSLNQHWSHQCGKARCNDYGATFFIKPRAAI